MITLLSNATANGAGPEVALEQQQIPGPRTLHLWGTFDGATVTIEVSPDGTQWNPLPDGVFTAADVKDIKISASKLRAVVSAAGASTSISIAIS